MASEKLALPDLWIILVAQGQSKQENQHEILHKALSIRDY